MNKLFISIIILVAVQASLAGIDVPDFRDLTMEDGLPSNYVTCITQDSRGFMWFGTSNGLVRYDGYHCKIYQNYSEESGGISYFSICSLLNDSKGILWIGTFARGLNRYDPEQDTFIWYKLDTEDSTSICSNHLLNALYEDSQGQLWIGTVHGLNRYDADHDCFIRYTNTLVDSSAVRPEAINCIFEDSKKNFWLGTEGGGLVLYDRINRKAVRFKHNPKNHRSISNNFIYSIFEDKSGVLWVGSESGFDCLRYSGDGPIFTHEGKGMPSHICSKTVYDVYTNKDCSELIHQVPQADFIDSRGNIWIATIYGGVKYYNASKNAFHTYRYEHGDSQGLKNASVLAFYENKDGSIWIGVDHGGLHLFNRKILSFTHYPLDPGEPDDTFNETVLTLEKDSDGDLWIGTYGKGVYRMNHKSGQFTHYMPEQNNPASLNFPIVYSIFEDSRKNIWLGTYGKGMSLYDRKNDGFLQTFPYIYKNLVRKFYEDSQKNLWICTSPGLYLYNRDNMTFREWQPDPNAENSLSSNWVTLVFEDSRSDKWIGTGYGLNHFNPEDSTFTLYTAEKDGLPNSYIAGILEDDNGYLWLSTGIGLSKFDPVNSTFNNYDVYDGLQGNQFNTNACFKSKTGELFFGGVHGFTYFYPDSIQDVENIPTVAITDFQLFNKSIKPGYKNSPLQKEISLTDEIRLTHDQHSFSFEFAVLDYINPKTNRYKYMLEGFQKDWIETGADRRVATFTNLDPGQYIFRVRGANNKGIWSEKGASIKIIIAPPFWKTWWFRILIFIAFLGIILTLHFYQVSRRLEMERMRIRIASDLHDDIGASLTKIAVHSEIIQSKSGSQKVLPSAEKIGQVSREVISSMSDIVWSIDARNDTVGDLLDRMNDFIANTLTSNDIQVNIKTAGMDSTKNLSVDKRQNLYLIFKEAVNNIAKHSGATNVDIQIENNEKGFLMRIKDNGKGLDISEKQIGHGLINMKMRAERIGANLTFHSDQGMMIELNMKSI